MVINICCFSCKKDKDVTPPRISISDPIENQSFNVNDYVHVTASVSDETHLESVSITLLDASQAPAYNSMSLPVTGALMNINTSYLLDNIHLSTGLYFIRVAASDGEHDTYAYRQIYISAVPKALKKVLLFTNSVSTQTNLSYIDSTFSAIVPFHTFSGDHLASGVTSYYQQAYECGNYTGDFTALGLQYNTNRFVYSSVPSSAPYFTGFWCDEQHSYIARYDGAIRGYDDSGSGIFTANSLSGFYAQHMLFHSDRLLAEEKDITSATKKLVVYFTSGGLEQSVNMSQDAVELCEKDATSVFVFGNVSGQGVIQLYDKPANNLWSPYPFPLATGSILSVLKLDADTYLIAHSNGTIYKYQYSVNSLTTYMTGFTAIKMRMDEVNNVLYVAEANKVSTFAYPSLTPVNTINSPETILDLQLLYNR
ncbi:MAG: hypothetical protein ACJ77K_10110 [Bacteroidia bacterium]